MPINHCQMAIKKRIMTAKVIGYMKPDIDPNTRLYVPFNEGVGDLAKDYSQYCNHAQLTDVEWSPDGFNGAGKFNGNSSFGDCGNDASLDITNEITMEVEVETNDNTLEYQSIINKGWATDPRYWVFLRTDKIRFQMVDSGGNSHVAEFINAQNNTWYHVVARWTSGEKVKLYVNDVIYETASTLTTSAIADPNKNIRICKTVDGADYFNGTIDNVIISSTAKSVAQAAADCYEVVCG